MKKEIPCLDCRGQGFISKFNEKSAWLERCPNCGGTGVITVVVTNADRIRAMSDEEMATELLPLFEELCEDGIPSTDYMRFWLKQPAEEDT